MQAHVELKWEGTGRDENVEEVVVTRVAGPAADTPSAANTVAVTRLQGTDVPLPAPDTDYGLSLFYRDWAGNLSAPTKLQVTSTHRTTATLAAPSHITYGATVTLTGRLSHDYGDEKVSLYARRAGTTTPILQSSTYTTGDGSFSFQASPDATTEYTVRYDGNQENYPAISPARAVAVTPVISFGLSTSKSVRGRGVTLTGTVKPNQAGQRVSIQRYFAGTWRVIGYATLSSTSSYRYVLKPTTAGTWKLRIGKGANREHPVAYSPAHYLYVR
jgi:hypothetical protein